MAAKFNADEIFEIAEQIEKNGAAFYRKAAETLSDEKHEALLQELAAMEDDHLKTFHQLRQELTAGERADFVPDPEGQAEQYLRAFASGHVFDLQAEPAAFLAGGRTLEEILVKAIQIEKDSVAFYVGIEALVPQGLGRGHVKEIIQQDMGHITQLSERLREVK